MSTGFPPGPLTIAPPTAPENFVPFMPSGPATAQTVLQTLEGASTLLGPNGQNWLQGALTNPIGQVCVVAALERAAPNYASYAEARDALKAAGGTNHLDRWNNSSTWPEVAAVLARATAVARALT